MILSTDPFAFDETIMFQICDDSLNSAFRDSNLDRDLAQDLGSILRKQDQNVRVIGEKRPARFLFQLLSFVRGFGLFCGGFYGSWCGQLKSRIE